MVNKKKKYNPLGILRAKLSVDQGFAERPIYNIRGKTTEKDKGLYMMDLIEKIFSISDEDRMKFFKERVQEMNDQSQIPTEYPNGFEPKKIQWTRDESGRIISPFKLKPLNE